MRLDRNHSHHDVVVVGARCAGAATAMLLARAGHNVVAVDRASFPSDTLSTHGLVRGGVVQLARWGLLGDVLASGATQVREVAFHRDGAVITRRIKETAGVDCFVAPRRVVLDELLVQAARRAGAEVREQVIVVDVLRGRDRRVQGVVVRDRSGATRELSASYVVGADGLRSRVARLVDAPIEEHVPGSTGIFCTYSLGGDWPAYEFHVARGAFAGVFPTNGGASLWLCRPLGELADLRTAGPARRDAFLGQLDVVAPDLATRARSTGIEPRVRGAVGLPNVLRMPTGPGWALVGDAGYHRDPITGHGMTDAFRDAELLTAALHRALDDPGSEAAALAEFRAAREAALRPVWDLTRELSGFPHPDTFVELQIRLADALEREALDLAARPSPAGLAASAA